MRRQSYRFIIRGTAALGQTWRVDGTVHCSFPQIIEVVLQRAFNELTQGGAVFGRPGLGCRGPYEVVEFNAELDDDPITEDPHEREGLARRPDDAGRGG